MNGGVVPERFTLAIHFAGSQKVEVFSLSAFFNITLSHFLFVGKSARGVRRSPSSLSTYILLCLLLNSCRRQIEDKYTIQHTVECAPLNMKSIEAPFIKRVM